MALTPEDVVSKRFQPTKFREGYDQDEVDDFLDEVVAELRRLSQENDELRQGQASGTAPVADGSVVAAPETAEASATSLYTADVDDETASTASLLQLARRLHEEHVREGIQRRDALIAEGEASAARVAAEAEADQEARLAEATAARELRLAEAETAQQARVADLEAEQQARIVEIEAEQQARIAELEAEQQARIAEAEAAEQAKIGALDSERRLLEQRVDELRAFEREYRENLKNYIEGQLRDLDATEHVSADDLEDADEGSTFDRQDLAGS
jgi:DivIVA domain-containing protein